MLRYRFSLLGLSLLITGCGLTLRSVLSSGIEGTSSVVPHHVTVLSAPQALNTAAHAIDRAQYSVQLDMYELGNSTLLHALVSAHHRGVQVDVLLDPTERQSRVSGPWLIAHGVTVRWAHDASGGIDHVKLLVVDGHWVELGGVNWGRHSTWTRDRVVVIPQAPAYSVYFQRAWTGYSHAMPPAGVYASPVLGPALVASVTHATGPVWLIEDYLTDHRLEQALAVAATRVSVHVILRHATINQAAASWLATHDVSVRWAPSTPWLHEKSVVAGSVWWIGSANGSWHGLYGPNVELDARLTGTAWQIGRAQAETLWTHSHPFAPLSS